MTFVRGGKCATLTSIEPNSSWALWFEFKNDHFNEFISLQFDSSESNINKILNDKFYIYIFKILFFNFKYKKKLIKFIVLSSNSS